MYSIRSSVRWKKDEMNEMLKKHNSDIVELSSFGIQRGTILSDNWHAKNPSLCAHVFGFHAFDEFKVYCSCLFPDTPLYHGRQSSDPISEWDKCAMMKLRMRRGTTLQMIGSIWNRCRTAVGAYITEWAPK